MIQLPLLNLLRMRLHLLHIPANAQIPAPQEISPGRIEVKRDTTHKCLFVLCEGREGVDDRATVVGCNDAGMDGEDADVGVF